MHNSDPSWILTDTVPFIEEPGLADEESDATNPALNFDQANAGNESVNGIDELTSTYAAHRISLVTRALEVGNDLGTAEDVVQEVTTKTLEAMSKGEADIDLVKAYLYRGVINRAISAATMKLARINRPGAVDATEYLADFESSEYNPEAAVEASSRALAVHGLLASFPTRRWGQGESAGLEIVRETFLDDKPDDLIAAEHEMTPNAVQTARSRTLRALREHAAEQGITPDTI